MTTPCRSVQLALRWAEKTGRVDGRLAWHHYCNHRTAMTTLPASSSLPSRPRRPLRERMSSGLDRMSRRLRSQPSTDHDVETRVRATLQTRARQQVHARADRGCVVLSGTVGTEDRADVVQDVARVRGVDSIIDLMSERMSRALRRAPIAVATASRPRLFGFHHPALAGVGLGLAVAGLRLRTRVGLSLAAFGVVLLAKGIGRPARAVPAVW